VHDFDDESGLHLLPDVQQRAGLLRLLRCVAGVLLGTPATVCERRKISRKAAGGLLTRGREARLCQGKLKSKMATRGLVQQRATPGELARSASESNRNPRLRFGKVWSPGRYRLTRTRYEAILS
jgi:hypothetical protein